MLPVFAKVAIFFLLFTWATASGLLAQNPGKTIIGLTAGTSCQSSDVRNDKGGFGASLTLGKEFPTTPDAPLAFELRARLLYARQYGLNPFPSYNIRNNTALNGTSGPNYLQYPAEYNIPNGFAYLNHRTTVGELGFEGVITFHQLRQKGLLLSLYGGLGLDWYLTQTDQLKNLFAFGEQPYYDEYASIDPNASQSNIRRQLRNSLDRHYETTADGFSEAGTINLMPSLGIEAGWQITPDFALIAGHRTTFTRDNIIDGQQWADDRNDLYHYNYLGLKFTLNKKKRLKKPVITVIHPATNPATTPYPDYTLDAKIRHVNSAANIRLLLNGRDIPFQFYNENLLTNLRLRPGRNEVSITATNTAGSDHKVVLIILEGTVVQSPIPHPTPTPPPTPPPSLRKPEVHITVPAKRYVETFEANVTVQANILYVPHREDVRVFVNGYEMSRFQYDGQRLNAYITLRPGSNTVRIRAINPAGHDEDKVTIVLKERISTPPPPPPPAGPAPQVNITRPANNSSTQQPAVQLRANIRHVQNRRDIRVLLNGKSISDFSFDGQQLRANLHLRNGSNTILVKAVNPFGESQDKVRISLSSPPPFPKPVITFINPAKKGERARKTPYALQVKIEHVRNKNDLELKVNGQKVRNFTYDSRSKMLRANISLKKGSNPIEITAVNEAGRSSASSSVVYETGRPVEAKPKVEITSITQPVGNPSNPNIAPSGLVAQTENVSKKSEISVTVNGENVDFSFNPKSGEITASFMLERGNSTIIVRVSTRHGQAQDKEVISW